MYVCIKHGKLNFSIYFTSGYIDHEQLIVYPLNTMEIPKESLYLKIKGHQVNNIWEIFTQTHTRTHAHKHTQIADLKYSSMTFVLFGRNVCRTTVKGSQKGTSCTSL